MRSIPGHTRQSQGRAIAAPAARGVVTLRRIDWERVLCTPYFENENAKIFYLEILDRLGGDRNAAGDVLPESLADKFSRLLGKANIHVRFSGGESGYPGGEA